ncbi:helix-turn-helix transcriptional regulator [Thalassobius sp. I31.1]|uniref:helix-turn-helix transcriptional regulator n=1 Tax=Thalassobius sp. I31.1 TaxID=2109912 RepID=UPI000D1AE5EE|nr:helix-turn-helix transcriptional regulator [Thalassobius sp. I31.1]
MDTSVPNTIAQLRKERGWTQDDLAARLRISITQLSRLERGASSLTQSRMRAIADVFGVRPEDLFVTRRSQENVDLDVIHAVVVQLDEMLVRLGAEASPQQRADLTIELYRLETTGLSSEDLAGVSVDLRKYEGMLRSLFGSR